MIPHTTKALSNSLEVVQFLQNPSDGNSNGDDQDRIVLD